MGPHARAHHQPGERGSDGRLVDWVTDRIFNDRELDHGILMLLLAAWIGCFHDTLGASSWWAEVFYVLPSWAWVILLSGVGSSRLILSRYGRGKALAWVALASCFIFGFMGFLVAIVRYQMSVTPLFFWLCYQAAKSHLRLMLFARRIER